MACGALRGQALVPDVIGSLHGRERSLGATQADDVVAEQPNEPAKDARPVTLGVDGDENHAHACGIGAEPRHSPLYFRQRRRTNVRTVRVAEKEHDRHPTLSRKRERVPVLIRQREIGSGLSGDRARWGSACAAAEHEREQQCGRGPSVGRGLRGNHLAYCPAPRTVAVAVTSPAPAKRNRTGNVSPAISG